MQNANRTAAKMQKYTIHKAFNQYFVFVCQMWLIFVSNVIK